MSMKIYNGKPHIKGDKYDCFILGKDTQTFGLGDKIDPHPENAMPWSMIMKDVKGDNQNPIQLFDKLVHYDASNNKRSFCGNKIVYEYFLEAMMKTRYKGGKTAQEIYEANPIKVWERVCKIDRRKNQEPNGTDVFELNRAITFFKPSIAKHLCERFQAKAVLDPCAGWGGRMLGCVSAGCDYLGYDTNPDLVPCYKRMIDDLRGHWKWVSSCKGQMNWYSCLEYPSFTDNYGCPYEYDLVITSPPYENLEVYEGMNVFENDEDYYVNFLIPMIDKCRRWIATDGNVCINISPKIYEKLTQTYHYEKAVDKIDFLQQMGQKSGKKEDFIYVWKEIRPSVSL